MMTHDYNDFSEPQRAAVECAMKKVFPILLPDHVFPALMDTLIGDKNTLTVSDFGCAGGKNSLFFLENLRQRLKSRHSDLEIYAFLTDLISNDFNAVFQAFQNSPLVDENNFFLRVAGGSCYSRLFPQNSTHLCMSFATIHWLSPPISRSISFKNPTTSFITLADPVEDKEAVSTMLDHSKKDLENFLLSRLSELIPGGILAFNCLGYSKNHLFPTSEDEEALRQYNLFEMETKEIRPSPIRSYHPVPTCHRIGRLFSLLLTEASHQFLFMDHHSKS
jgi:SAM-dependent methyltransferase